MFALLRHTAPMNSPPCPFIRPRKHSPVQVIPYSNFRGVAFTLVGAGATRGSPEAVLESSAGISSSGCSHSPSAALSGSSKMIAPSRRIRINRFLPSPRVFGSQQNASPFCDHLRCRVCARRIRNLPAGADNRLVAGSSPALTPSSPSPRNTLDFPRFGAGVIGPFAVSAGNEDRAEADLGPSSLTAAMRNCTRGRRFPPQDLVPPRCSRNLPFPAVTDPEAPPLRTERHVPNSIATMRRRLIVALATTLPRCPCCAAPIGRRSGQKNL